MIVTGDDFEKIKAEKDRPIQILHFNDLSSIHPLFITIKTYHTVPETGGGKLELLAKEAKQNRGCETVMGQRKCLLSFQPMTVS